MQGTIYIKAAFVLILLKNTFLSHNVKQPLLYLQCFTETIFYYHETFLDQKCCF